MRRIALAARQLAVRIATVFADVPRPEPDTVLHSQCLDPVPVGPLLDSGAWQDVPREVLIRHYDASSFFSPEAFRFFLAAYMIAMLELFRVSTDYVSSATFHELVGYTDYARSRYALFAPLECQVVVEVLKLMVASPDDADAENARSAIDSF